ncbi:hypothetical protein FGW37_28970 [Streptomyces rectiverticillatus]|uniref:hypothetical protein n=1 Tax=Streptomyces rectiverticillatus TaxID=173860 RepID=UPI0015C338F0|nr:hypothetical protein [Streptomyces rectiverticillatus]QLE75102.1 hypothetical protein FGW37_28970 [Streptomyces rectiverticillatus]
MKVELSIGRLVLEGVVPGHRAAALSRALEAELGALLAAAPPGGQGDLDDLDDLHLRRAATAPVRATADPAALGRRIARAVHGALATARPSLGGPGPDGSAGARRAAPAATAAHREAAR